MFSSPYLFGSYELAVLLKILLAAVGGGLIGIERERHGRPAGLRTHLLVAVGACLMMIVSESFYLKYGGLEAEMTATRLDPARVAAQIVTGIGFIGAGVIIKEGLAVRGLTTAASLWLVAGLGMAFGAGLIWPGMVATAVALFGLVVLKRFEPSIPKDRYLHLTLTTDRVPDVYPEIERTLCEKKMIIRALGSTIDLESQTTVYRLTLTQHGTRVSRDLASILSELPGIRKITFD
ncbi:MgtC/SapB family protein [Geoalkalibacter halelectricus]|uniref:MgtC/SapB family protein n=1 Tax=Geoalkalibacter halelectricus TaxID=2847045 RepID=A0ABY5ZLF5_9BACT|nr:MgtC/SapB family protein [Geoalkalibacter halelectricus]MDO3379506.1 MgtC/SapB family protein [Geoalkalibacter halelectricus]UWZ78096.1 MgtC/SapB family protein [Geoalkalibacter halelectricus]